MGRAGASSSPLPSIAITTAADGGEQQQRLAIACSVRRARGSEILKSKRLSFRTWYLAEIGCSSRSGTILTEGLGFSGQVVLAPCVAVSRKAQQQCSIE